MRVNSKVMWICAICTFLTYQSFAQISQGGEPISFVNKGNTFGELAPVRMPAVNVEQLRAEDAITDQHKDIPTRFAYAHNVNIAPSNAGEFTQMSNGDRIWRVAVQSEGAFSLNMTFSEYSLAPGARLFLYSPDHTSVAGAFTEKNNKQTGEFAVQPIRGEIAIVELYEPASEVGNSRLKIGTVAHDYRDFFKMAVDFGSSGACNNNANCPVGAAWQDEKRGVAMITLANGTRWCSGSMINNTNEDGTPYFLTANHCLTSSVSTWIFYFNYESPGCTNVNGPLNQSISGCTQLGANAASDWALLELSSTPPAAYNIYYNGWDATGAIPSSTVGIHHPAGDIKKISFDDNPSTITAYSSSGGGTTHWRVADWDDGTTEGGSSGSPLFDQNHRIIGQLHGGGAACGNNLPDWYGRISVSYSGLCQWLAPGCNATIVDGYDPNQPSVALDAQITTMPAPLSLLCAAPGQSYSVAINLRNAGMDVLTSATINWTVNGVGQTPFSWTGNLNPNQSTLIVLGGTLLDQGQNEIVATASNPNGSADQNPANDSVSKTISVGSNDLSVAIITDRYGNETTWSIVSDEGITVGSGGPYAQAATNGEYTQPTINLQCIPDGCYTFTINDSFGDGICCAYGSGAYLVTDGDGNMLVSGGTNFTGDSESMSFCIQNVATEGCTNSNACNYNEDADIDDGSCVFVMLVQFLQILLQLVYALEMDNRMF